MITAARRKKNQIKSLVILTCFTVALIAFSAGVSSASTQRLVIGTASTGGTWYPLGGGIAKIINKHVPNVDATAQPSGASIENIRAIGDKKMDFALLMPDAAFFGFKGAETFKAKRPHEELRGVFSTYPIEQQIFVLADSPVKRIQDLKGKKIGLGAPGSGTEVMSRLILAEYGIEYKDITPQFLHHPETVSALKDKTIEAGMTLLGTPAPALMELTTTHKVRFLDQDPKIADKIIEKYPFYFKSIIPGNTYKGQEKDYHTLSYVGILATHKDLPEKLVYDVVKAVFENIGELHQIHVAFKQIVLKDAVKGMPIPWHPGAHKYFKEKGLLK
ncbi:MAG: TAXI family TRAP transporter solute-binding subunit [Deltaproteobacteria bacterium]|nr:TAXI family TRAP transporter solute-binding subunit [Deltaproteobacteria bacterium]